MKTIKKWIDIKKETPPVGELVKVKVVDDIQNEYTFPETDPGTYMSTSAFSVQPNRS